MLKHTSLVPLLALSLALPATAGPLERVDNLITHGRTEQAIQITAKQLAHNPGDSDLKKLLAKAYFAHAASYNSVDAWQDFRRRYPEGKWHDEAYAREAKAAWRDIAGTRDRDLIAKYRVDYPGGPLEARATQIEANLFFRDVSLDGSVEAWTAFIQRFPDDPRSAEAAKKMEIAALSKAREGESVASLRQFLVDYPDSPRRGEVMRDLIKLTSHLAVGCPGTPPTCISIDSGTEITASWDPIEGVPTTARLLAWSEAEGTMPVDKAMERWSGPGWPIEVQQIAAQFLGETTESSWRLSLDFPLKRPGDFVDGYAVEIRAEGAAPTVLPFKVSAAWTSPSAAAAVTIYRMPNQLAVGTADGAKTTLATVPDIPLNDPNKAMRNGSNFYAWGRGGLVRVDLDSGGVQRVVGGREVQRVWPGSHGLAYEMQSGSKSELVYVDEEGNQRTLMPTPGRPDAPREFRTMAVSEGGPVAVLHLTSRGWGVVPRGGEARPLSVPESVPKARESASVAIDPDGENTAFFVNDKRSRVVLVRISDGRSTEFAVDTQSLFNAPSVTWGRATWSNEYGLVAEALGSRNRLMGIVKLENGKVTVVGDEIIELALGKDPRAPDAEPGSQAFSYKQPLAAFLR